MILGKGPSADEVDAAVFADTLVIGINDAERIHPADIAILGADWAAQSVRDNGLKSDLYITPQGIDLPQAQQVAVPAEAMTQETTDLMIQRLLGDGIVLEAILFMTALQVAREIARLRGTPQTVYMIGFDFDHTGGAAHSAGITGHYDLTPTDDHRQMMMMQEFCLINALYVLRDGPLEVQHVGERTISALGTEELNRIMSPSSHTDGHDYAVKVVAELTTNHFGDRARLERMIRAAKHAGADFIKVQKREVESFYNKDQLDAPYSSPFGTTFRDYRNQIELGADDFAFIRDLCARIGIGWFVSVLDEPSYDFVMPYGPEIVKLPSTISEHTHFLEHVADLHEGPLLISTGMTDKAYENWVRETFIKSEKLILMQANSAYPTQLHDCGVGVVRHYHSLSKQDPRIVPAYSSHDFGWFGSALAVAAGAKMVEKHVKLGNSDWAHFDAVALDMAKNEFHDFTTKMREAELAVGSETKTIRDSEHHKYRVTGGS